MFIDIEGLNIEGCFANNVSEKQLMFINKMAQIRQENFVPPKPTFMDCISLNMQRAMSRGVSDEASSSEDEY